MLAKAQLVKFIILDLKKISTLLGCKVGNLQREGKSLGEQPTGDLGVGSSLGVQEDLHKQGQERILC